MVTVIQQNGAKRGRAQGLARHDTTVGCKQVVDDRTPVSTGRDPGRITKRGEKSQAKSFCRFRVDGTNFQIDSSREVTEAPGVDNPESEQSVLVVLANDVLAEESGDGVEHFDRIG